MWCLEPNNWTIGSFTTLKILTCELLRTMNCGCVWYTRRVLQNLQTLVLPFYCSESTHPINLPPSLSKTKSQWKSIYWPITTSKVSCRRVWGRIHRSPANLSKWRADRREATPFQIWNKSETWAKYSSKSKQCTVKSSKILKWTWQGSFQEISIWKRSLLNSSFVA